MAGTQTRSFDSPDEQRTPPKTKVDIVKLDGGTAGRYTFEPGWRWSEAVKPIAKTDSCQSRHLGVVLSGRLHVMHDDGSESEAGPGDAYFIQPGHDAWVIGDEAFVGYEFDSKAAEEYAKPS